MPGAGDLDRRITIERHMEVSRDGFNEPIFDWSTLATVWAKRTDVSDGERVAAGQVGATLMSRFVVRSSAATRAVTAADRLAYDGATWNLMGVKETTEGRKRFLELTAIREAD